MAFVKTTSLLKIDYTDQVYVFQGPVRLWHWVHALCILVLCGSGYLIANPLPTMNGEASDSFVMGTIRLVHFTTAYVLTIGYLARIYWAIVGNHVSRELFIVPIWSKDWWWRVGHEIKMYAFLTKKVSKNIGHNPLAQIFMWLVNVLLLIFMICTGFALYSQGAGAGHWTDTLFGWVFVIEPSSQTVRMWHFFGMWLMLVFVVVHVYMVIRAEFMSRQNGVSCMIDGYRRFRDKGPRDLE
jgi:Ni/Fe-hydrogenase 1 B-type cytochrome subunit